MEPLVSVICITRNHERFCIESLDSVLNQTYKNIEWIIVDAASTDNTVVLIDNWLFENNVQSVFLKEKELKPVTVNLNKALTYANGEYVQFLSLDDVLLEKKLELQIECFKEDDTLGMVFGNATEIDENSRRNGEIFGLNDIQFENDNHGNWYRILIKHNFICAPTALNRTSTILKIGKFDNNVIFEDWDLWLLMAKQKINMKFMNLVLVEYRRLATSLSNQKNAVPLIGALQIFKKHKLPLKNILPVYIYFDCINNNEKLKVIKFLIKNYLIMYLSAYVILYFDDEAKRQLHKYKLFNYL